jgi:hypothetical protein
MWDPHRELSIYIITDILDNIKGFTGHRKNITFAHGPETIPEK